MTGKCLFKREVTTLAKNYLYLKSGLFAIVISKLRNSKNVSRSNSLAKVLQSMDCLFFEFSIRLTTVAGFSLNIITVLLRKGISDLLNFDLL